MIKCCHLQQNGRSLRELCVIKHVLITKTKWMLNSRHFNNYNKLADANKGNEVSEVKMEGKRGKKALNSDFEKNIIPDEKNLQSAKSTKFINFVN